MEVFKRSPMGPGESHLTGKYNGLGVGMFHAFALWCAARLLAPPTIIESGVFAGVSSYYLRSGAPHANMHFLSPSIPWLYLDRGRNATYHTGKAFKDFSQMAWRRTVLSRAERAQSLVSFDDHQSALRRAHEAASFGFGWVIFDDNYVPGVGDMFALKPLCLGDDGLFDLFGAPPQWIDNFKSAVGVRRFRDSVATQAWRVPSSDRVATPLQWLDNETLRGLFIAYNAIVRGYFEFPPVWRAESQHAPAGSAQQAAWMASTKRPLLDHAAAQAFCAKHGLNLAAESLRYSHVAIAQLRG